MRPSYRCCHCGDCARRWNLGSLGYEMMLEFCGQLLLELPCQPRFGVFVFLLVLVVGRSVHPEKTLPLSSCLAAMGNNDESSPDCISQ